MINNVQMLILNISILVNIIASVIIFYIWTENKKKYADMKYFFFSLIFCIFSFIGLIFNEQYTSSFNIIVLLCGLAYYGFLLTAFQKFYSEKTARYMPYICGIITFFLTIHSYIYQQHFIFLKIFSFGIVSMLTIQIIIVLWKHRKQHKKIQYGIITILLLQFVLRTLLLVSASTLAELNTSPIFFSLLVLTLPISRVFISIAVIFLTGKRSKADIDIMSKTIENVFALSSEGIVITSTSGNFLNVNKSICEMVGYSEKELLASSWRHFIYQKNIQEIVQTYYKAKKTNQENVNFQIETKLIRKDKSIIWVLVSSSLVKDINNNPLYFISNVTRIDELKTRTMELEISEQNLRVAKEKAEKLSNAKSDFLAVVSHETRTPLTTILGITQLLKQSRLSKMQREQITKIEDAGGTLLRLLNDMLDMSKVESGKLDIDNQPFDFHKTFNNIMNINKLKADAFGNSFNSETIGYIPKYLIGDSLRLTQVMDNIIGNAIKFTRNGEITVKAKLAGGNLDEVDLEIIIQDTGIGMTPEQAQKLFNPFEQADTSITRKYGGTGLGMSISKKLIELMDGDIQVDSKYGVGTIFIIYLPLKIANENQIDDFEDSDYISSNEIAKKVQGKKVLVVEDHAINQRIICDILNHYDLDITFANNGAEAVDKVFMQRFDLIFMDIRMPIMDGLTATEKIRNMKDTNKSSIPIIAMSAQAMNSDYKKSFDAGMNDHLTKPIDIDTLEKSLLTFLSSDTIREIPHNTDLNKPVKDNGSLKIIDSRMGLIRFRNDKAKYKLSLQEFVDYKDSVAKLEVMIDDKDYTNAIVLAHSVKGIAANLSLEKLSNSASKLEEKLLQYSEDILTELLSFSNDLNEVVEGIENKYLHKIINET